MQDTILGACSTAAVNSSPSGKFDGPSWAAIAMHGHVAHLAHSMAASFAATEKQPQHKRLLYMLAVEHLSTVTSAANGVTTPCIS